MSRPVIFILSVIILLVGVAHNTFMQGTALAVGPGGTTENPSGQSPIKMLYRNSFTAGLAKGAASGDVTIQSAPSGGGKYVQVSVADKSNARFAVNDILLGTLSDVEVRFKYRSTASYVGPDRGSWVHICFYRANGTSAGDAAMFCQPTTQWKELSQAFAVPDGAFKCTFEFRMQEVNGKFDIADIAIAEPAKVSDAIANAQDIEYAKAYRCKANLNYQKTGNTVTLQSPELTLQTVDQEAPYGFVLPDELCDNPELIYEVECTFRPRWSSREAKDANMVLALGRNIMGNDYNSFSLTIWGGNGVISRLRAAEGGVGAEIRNPITISAGQRYTLKTRWSESEETLWINGQAIARSVMPKKFSWQKGRTFYILGESKERGLLNADVEKFSLKIYEPRIKVAFDGSPRDLGYFTGAGPFTTALAFPTQNGKTLASTLTVLDIQDKEIATLKPTTVTAQTHGYTLPSLPLGWYKLSATIVGEGAEKQVTLPISITAAPATREPAEESLYGITEEWPFGRNNFDAATVDALMYRLSQMGIRWFRAWICWDYTEESPGVYYWDGLDQFVAIAQKYGIEVYPVLHGGSKAFMMPPANQPLSHNGMISAGYYLPSDMTLWKNYVRAFVTHYKGKIHYYQAWNEADTRQFLYPFKSEAYAAWLKETAAVIRSVDPSAKIGLGGFCAAYSETMINSTSHTDKDSAYGLAEWYAQKPQNDYDIVDFHFYSATGARQSWDGTVPLAEKIHRFLAANGDGGKPMWNSETSFSSTDNPKMVGVQGGLFNAAFLSEREHAYRVVQWHVQSKAVNIKHNFNYTVRGESGMIHSDYSAKPAYTAQVNLTTTLAGLKYQRTLPFNRNIRAYQFGNDNRCVTVLWAMDGSEILVAKSAVKDKPLTRIDLYGNRSKGDGILTLTEEPLYFESQQPPMLQELIGVQLPEIVLAGMPYEAMMTVRNPFESELNCSLNTKAAGKSQTHNTFQVPAGQDKTQPLKILSTGSPLTIEGTLSGAAAQDFYLELPITPKKAVVVSSTTPGRFEITQAAQVRMGGQVIDNQNRVMSEGNWKGKDDLSASGTVTLRDRAVTITVDVKDDAIFPEATGKAPWDGDAVEFFFDLRTTEQKTQSSMEAVVQLVVAANGKHVITRNQTLQDLVVRAEKTASGYTITVTFTLPAHITKTFGFDVSLDDADTDTAGRKVQMIWAGNESNHISPAAYGVVFIK